MHRITLESSSFPQPQHQGYQILPVKESTGLSNSTAFQMLRFVFLQQYNQQDD